MRIGLLSDTHIPDAARDLWPEILEAFAGVDLILHAGDLMVPRVVDDLEQVAPTLAAQGNHDEGLHVDPRIQPVHILDLEGHTLVLLHQFDPFDWGFKKLSRILPADRHADIVIYGDTHYEHVEVMQGTLVINPGSPTFPRNLSSRLGHIGLLTLERDRPPEVEIVDLSNGHVDHIWRDAYGLRGEHYREHRKP